MQVESFDVADVRAVNRLRAADPKKVEAIAASIAAIGLRTPITVRVVDDVPDEEGVLTDGVPFLVAGLHRLEAARSLGWTTIAAVVIEGDETDARMWEIAENLHRADLTVQERADQLAEWIKLSEAKAISSQDATKVGRPESGVNAAARSLGVSKDEAHRAVKIASLTPEAREAADAAGLITQKARLAIAAEPNAEAQLLAIQREADAAEAKRRNRETDSVIASAEAQEFAEWLDRHAPEMATTQVVSWLQGTKPAEVIAAFRRLRA